MSKPTPKPIGPDVSTLKDADYTRVADTEKSFKFFKKVSDPRFGEIAIIQNPQTRQFLAVKERKITDRKEAGQTVLFARQRIALKHPNILNLVDYSVAKQSELCSSFYIVKLFFEYPKSDLRKEIQERERLGESFTDVELTHLLYQQVKANSFLHAKDIYHGDIQPLHIGYDRDAQESKLIERFDDITGSPNRIKQLQKNRLISGQPLYQSPDTYSNLKKGNLTFVVDPSKEDAFALGLTLLEAGNGRSVQNIYDSKSGVLSRDALDAHIKEFQGRYGGQGSLLPKAVAALVGYTESERWGFRELESRLPEYDQVKQSLSGINRNVQGQPIVLQAIIQEEAPHRDTMPDLFNPHAKFSNANPSLMPDPYTHFVQNTAPAQGEYSYIPSNPQDSGERKIINLDDHSNQQHGYSFAQPTNNSYTAYTQPNTTYVSYSQPYEVIDHTYEYKVQGGPGDYLNNNNGTYYTQNQGNYVYAQPETQYIQNRYVQNQPVIVKESVTTEISHDQTVNISGLKLVKTYTDPSKATDVPNY